VADPVDVLCVGNDPAGVLMIQESIARVGAPVLGRDEPVHPNTTASPAASVTAKVASISQPHSGLNTRG
jgi:hypothetical protein